MEGFKVDVEYNYLGVKRNNKTYGCKGGGKMSLNPDSVKNKDFSVELPCLIGKLSILEEVFKAADIDWGYPEMGESATWMLYEIAEELRAINEALYGEEVQP